MASIRGQPKLKGYRDGGRVIAHDEAPAMVAEPVSEPPPEPTRAPMPRILMPPPLGYSRDSVEPPPQSMPRLVPEKSQKRNSIPMAAPPSREVPTYSGKRQADSSKMKLTAEERYVARHSFSAPDMTDTEKELAYARAKKRMLKMRADGELN